MKDINDRLQRMYKRKGLDMNGNKPEDTIKEGFMKRAMDQGLNEKQALGIWDKAPHNQVTKKTVAKNIAIEPTIPKM